MVLFAPYTALATRSDINTLVYEGNTELETNIRSDIENVETSIGNVNTTLTSDSIGSIQDLSLIHISEPTRPY